MEEEDHFTQTQLLTPNSLAALAAAAMAARLLPLQPFTFSLGFSTALSTLSLSLLSLSLGALL